MEIPFSVEAFLGLFETYNLSIQPIQLIAYGLGAVAVAFAAVKSLHSTTIILTVLATFWAWTGIVYHIVFFSEINRAAIAFGALFLAQAFILLYAAFRAEGLTFEFSMSVSTLLGAGFIAYAMLAYPILNYAFGHAYPKMPVFGVAPCPVTIFTFGLLLLIKEKVPLYLLVIPFLWSLVGASAAIQLNITEDYGLAVAGIVGTVFTLTNNRRKNAKA